MSLTHHSILSLSLCVSVDICRDKAAFSRNKTIESMEEVAQGRVWTGQDAHGHGLVDICPGDFLVGLDFGHVNGSSPSINSLPKFSPDWGQLP